jgi:hypothetical protein
MAENPLKSLAGYSGFLSQVLDRPSVRRSTLVVWSDSPWTGTAEGEITFANGARLRVREELDFDAGLITAYGYEVSRGGEALYWYDDFPHPNDPALAATFPHHKHVPPDIKHHRVPAPEISFTRPNLPEIVRDAEQLK